MAKRTPAQAAVAPPPPANYYEHQLGYLVNVTLPFDVERVDPATGEVVPWLSVTQESVKSIVVADAFLREQLQIISGTISHWGQVVTEAKRVWEVRERQYRQWRERLWALTMRPPVGSDAKWKKPTKEAFENHYRTHKEYAVYQRAIELAEYVHGCASSVLEGYRVKKSVLERAVYRNQESGAAMLAV